MYPRTFMRRMLMLGASGLLSSGLMSQQSRSPESRRPPIMTPPPLEARAELIPAEADAALRASREREAAFIRRMRSEGFDSAWSAWMASDDHPVRATHSELKDAELAAGGQLTFVALRLQKNGDRVLAGELARGLAQVLGEDPKVPERGLKTASPRRDMILGLLYDRVLNDPTAALAAFQRVEQEPGMQRALAAVVARTQLAAHAANSVRAPRSEEVPELPTSKRNDDTDDE